MNITIIEDEGFFADGKPIKDVDLTALAAILHKAKQHIYMYLSEKNRTEAQTVLYYATELFGKEEDGIITWKI